MKRFLTSSSGRGLAILAAAGLALTGLAREASPSFEPGKVAVGCNYWASHAGVYMWRDWNAAQVEKDLDLLAAHGMTVLRAFPLWPDFQPLTADYGQKGVFRGYSQNGGPLANAAAVDEEMVKRFRFLCDAADKRGLKLIVGLVTGWMSGRMFVPPALERENVLTSPAAIKWQVRYVRHLVGALKDCPAIVAWDFGNECNCMGEATADEMWVWLHALAAEIRLADPSRRIVSGMHGVGTRLSDKANARQQEELSDVLTTHPYPLWTPNCNLERFDSLRNACHAPCETTFYADLANRPAIVEEAGSMGPGIASEEVAAHCMRMQLYGSWAVGVPMYLWWCAFDQEKFAFPPYEWCEVERELGLFTSGGKPKPTALELAAFAAFQKSLPFGCLPPRQIDATVIVSENEDAWTTVQGAWLLARQAHFDIRYARAEDPLPESAFYILPSGKELGAYSRTAWERVLGKVRAGATLLVTLGDGAILSGLRAAAGIEVEAQFARPCEIATTVDGRQVAFGEPQTRLVRAAGAEVLVRDASGNVFMTEHGLGSGRVLFVNGAVERNAQLSGWPVYALAAKRAGVKRLVGCDDPEIGLSEHPLPDERVIVVAINHGQETLSVPLSVTGRIGKVFRGEVSDGKLTVGGCDAAAFEILP